METIAPFRISVCGIEELAGHCETGVSHVLSILDPDWPVPEAFGAFGEHAKLELRFHGVVEEGVAGTQSPREEHVAQLLAFGRDLMVERPPEAHLLVHCHAGVSRSTASMALVLAQGHRQVERGLADWLCPGNRLEWANQPRSRPMPGIGSRPRSSARRSDSTSASR